ncbi:5-dehydro-4-deoxy-D-glucuronate isomerase [Serinibacter arcticus]|uniref:5-dehydro-4-deoxy-D-glucuronate isomerase n=1 Tax=Serinibacter arcticus TaxID=1655435 RepID=A0A2U1ZT97_9MICO|nr:5-dehydro-4-deoxy-D-glucuronate isomerase [Serinibacter arcticus]PWD50208.1 5-dehydro-4-deoxy-D-glucuronate isomerase [Serinibacter arcticus]
MLQVRYSTSPSTAETATTTQLREAYLVEDLFRDGEVNGVYTHDDRLLVAGAVPAAGELALPSWPKVLGVETHLARRELGVVNVGGPGEVVVDGEPYRLEHLDGLFVGRGSDVTFSGTGAAFYLVSAPAHATFPTTLIPRASVTPVDLGSPEAANERRLYRYVWGQEVQSAALQIGMTVIAPGSVWNTFPPHLHDRRTEVYLYLDLAADDRVLHVMGRPGATRHLVVADRQAVISPPWSVHSGAGTGSYAFVWAMAGENTTYTDLAPVAVEEL